MRKIYIDAGHGGSDAGAVNGNRYEKTDTLNLAALIEYELEKQDVNVKLSRTSDISKGLSARISEANNWGADYFLSIHRNSFNGSASGHEAWVINTATTKTQQQAATILNAVVGVDNLANRGVKLGAPSYTNFAVNRDTKMPSCLLEVGFISNTKDNDSFDKNIGNYANAIARALCKILDVTWKEPILGDIDGDGKITAKDARKALRAAAGLEKLTDTEKNQADINKDGKITAKDAREILRKSAKLQ